MTTTERVAALIAVGDLSRVRRETIARAMRVHVTTMERRLRAEHTTYGALLMHERRKRCVDLFTMNPHADGELVRRRCGYIEINSAYKAFIRMLAARFLM